jgi:predicted RNA-binding protein with RPS1 domain
VYVCQGWRARSLLKDLSDGFVKDVSKAFPPGKLVAGRVLAVDPERRMVDLSLKGSAVTGVKTIVGEAEVEDASDDDSKDVTDSETELVGLPAKKLNTAPAVAHSSDSSDEGDSGSDSDAAVPTTVPPKGAKRQRFNWEANSEDEDLKGGGGGDVWEDDDNEGEEAAHTGRRARAAAKRRLETEVGANVCVVW